MRTRETWMARHSFEFLLAYAVLVVVMMVVGHAVGT
jgi:hypothetical protein